MAAAANPNPFIDAELLRAMTPERLEQLDDEDRRRFRRYVDGCEHDHINELCSREVASFKAGPLFWACNYTLTENPHWKQQGLEFKAPFPEKDYFVPLFAEFLSVDRILVPKSREMMTSWSFMLYAVFRAQWHKSDVIIQTGSLGKVLDLVGYASQLYRYQHDFLKVRHPLEKETQTELTWADGGCVRAIPSGADQIRLYHPTIVIFDECAFLPEFEDCWNTAHPVAKQMIGVSSAGPGRFADMCSR
jgi:hypothetical protein